MKNRLIFAAILAGLLIFEAGIANGSGVSGAMPANEEMASILFNENNPFVQKTYLVTVELEIQDNTVSFFVIASRGSGFVIEEGGKRYFMTANHVVAGNPKNPGKLRVTFTDYKGNEFEMAPALKSADRDLALFVAGDIKEKTILPETIIKKFGQAKLEETVYTCGNVMLGAFNFPVVLEKTVKGKARIDFMENEKPASFVYTVIHGGLEFGFSGGPTLNKNGELFGVNVLVTKAGQFGIVVESDSVKNMIDLYKGISK